MAKVSRVFVLRACRDSAPCEFRYIPSHDDRILFFFTFWVTRISFDNSADLLSFIPVGRFSMTLNPILSVVGLPFRETTYSLYAIILHSDSSKVFLRLSVKRAPLIALFTPLIFRRRNSSQQTSSFSRLYALLISGSRLGVISPRQFSSESWRLIRFMFKHTIIARCVKVPRTGMTRLSSPLSQVYYLQARKPYQRFPLCRHWPAFPSLKCIHVFLDTFFP